jgi:hypothetical protein
MNLNEQISRIQEVMGLINETDDSKFHNTMKQDILDLISELKAKIPPEATKVVDVNNIAGKLQNFLINLIPSTYENIKKGVGGDYFAYNLYKEIIKILKEELNKIGWIKKKAIQFLAPKNKKDYISIAQIEADDSPIPDEIIRGLDLGFFVQSAFMYDDVMKKYEDNAYKFSQQYRGWIKKNYKPIKDEIIKILGDFIYG